MTAVLPAGGAAAAAGPASAAEPAANAVQAACYDTARYYTSSPRSGSGNAHWPGTGIWAYTTRNCTDINLKVGATRRVRTCFKATGAGRWRTARAGQWGAGRHRRQGRLRLLYPVQGHGPRHRLDRLLIPGSRRPPRGAGPGNQAPWLLGPHIPQSRDHRDQPSSATSGGTGRLGCGPCRATSKRRSASPAACNRAR